MKRAIILVILLFTGLVVAITGYIKHNPITLDIGLVLMGGIVLAVLVAILKAVWSFVINSITSVLFIGIALIALGIMSWFARVNAFIGFATGLGLGTIFIWLLFRRLGKWAQTSLIGGAFFSFVSAYKISTYPLTREPSERDAKTVYNTDYKSIVLVLKEQGFPATKAKEAANYAITQVPNELPLEEKIREALRFLGDGHKNPLERIRE
jgi:hypothetical protein